MTSLSPMRMCQPSLLLLPRPSAFSLHFLSLFASVFSKLQGADFAPLAPPASRPHPSRTAVHVVSHVRELFIVGNYPNPYILVLKCPSSTIRACLSKVSYSSASPSAGARALTLTGNCIPERD